VAVLPVKSRELPFHTIRTFQLYGQTTTCNPAPIGTLQNQAGVTAKITRPFNNQQICPAATAACTYAPTHPHILLHGRAPDERSTATIMDDVRAPPKQANPGTGSEANPLAPTNAGGNIANGPLPLRHGHELPFVAPSSYLRPKQISRTMSDKTPSPLDKDQMQGLVSIYPETTPVRLFSLGSSQLIASPPLPLLPPASLVVECTAAMRGSDDLAAECRPSSP